MPPIECKLGYAETPVGNETYIFAKDRHGRFVAEVASLKHIEILLSRPEVYARVDDVIVGSTALTSPDTGLTLDPISDDELDEAPDSEEEEAARLAQQQDELLLGSDILPASIQISPELAVSLGDVVAKAHQNSGLSVADWNALASDAREKLLLDTVETMQREANSPPSDLDTPDEPAVDDSEEEEGPAPPDDLAVLNGLGPSSAAKLRGAGVLYIAQLAALTPAAMAALDTQLGLNGLSARANWVAEAQTYLAQKQG